MSATRPGASPLDLAREVEDGVRTGPLDEVGDRLGIGEVAGVPADARGLPVAHGVARGRVHHGAEDLEPASD